MPGKKLPLTFTSDTDRQLGNWKNVYHIMNIESQLDMDTLEFVESRPRCWSWIVVCRSRLQTFYRFDITFLLTIAQSPPIMINKASELRWHTRCRMMPYHSLRCRGCLHGPWWCRWVASNGSAITEMWNRLRTKHKTRRVEVVETIALQVLPVAFLFNCCCRKDRSEQRRYISLGATDGYGSIMFHVFRNITSHAATLLITVDWI